MVAAIIQYGLDVPVEVNETVFQEMIRSQNFETVSKILSNPRTFEKVKDYKISHLFYERTIEQKFVDMIGKHLTIKRFYVEVDDLGTTKSSKKPAAKGKSRVVKKNSTGEKDLCFVLSPGNLMKILPYLDDIVTPVHYNNKDVSPLIKVMSQFRGNKQSTTRQLKYQEDKVLKLYSYTEEELLYAVAATGDSLGLLLDTYTYTIAQMEKTYMIYDANGEGGGTTSFRKYVLKLDKNYYNTKLVFQRADNKS
jgi:hypothetical protein